MDFKWYEELLPTDGLEQGDIVERCNVFIPNAKHHVAVSSGTENTDPIDIIEFNGIVMSQSCDIQNEKIDSIIICPIWSLGDLIKRDDHFKSSKAREGLRQGLCPQYHLLNKVGVGDLPEDYYFVDFQHIYSVPKDFLVVLIGGAKRIRLLPPYREHLSQSFARYFMRVGLPTDISKDDIKNYSH
jgi:hypothetical protein